MKSAQEVLWFLIAITLIAAGAWYTQAPGDQYRPFVVHNAGAATAGQFPQVCGNYVDWSEDGQTLLVRYRGERGSESRVAIHKLGPPGKRILIDPIGDSSNSAALSPDGSHLYVGSHEGRLWWIDVAGIEAPEPIIESPEAVSFTAFAIDDRRPLLAAGTNVGSIYLYDRLRKSSVILHAGAEHSGISSLCISSDGEQLLAALQDGRLCLWNVSTGELVQEFAGHHGIAKGGAFLSDGRQIISAGLDDTVRIWDIEGGRELWRGEFGQEGINALAVSRDGRLAAWGGHHRRILVWDLVEGRRKFQIDTTAAAVFHLKFSPDGTRLAVAGQEERVRVYDMMSGAESDSIPLGTTDD